MFLKHIEHLDPRKTSKLYVGSSGSAYPASITTSRESLGLAKKFFVASTCSEILSAFFYSHAQPPLVPRALRGAIDAAQFLERQCR
jgi:hypothetical protein